MKKDKYSKEQINEIKRNKYVKNCTSKSILFTEKFKNIALKEWKSGKVWREIFEKYGFPEYIVKTSIPKDSIKRWRKKKDKPEIVEKKKGRKQWWSKGKKTWDMTLREENYYLKAKLAYYEEVEKYMKGWLP